MTPIIINAMLAFALFGSIALMGAAQWDMQRRYAKDRIKKYTFLSLLILPFVISLTVGLLPVWAYMIVPIVYMAFHLQSRKAAVLMCAMLVLTGINASADTIRHAAGIEYNAGLQEKSSSQNSINH